MKSVKIEGKRVVVGDTVGFKDDVEMYGTVMSIENKGKNIVVETNYDFGDCHWVDVDRAWLS